MPATFLRQSFRFLTNPRAVGSVAPSSRYLGEAMSNLLHGCDEIIELGAGEGSITKVITQCHGASKVRAIEFDSRAAQILTKKMPNIRVEVCCASEALGDMGEGISAKSGILSCLPLMSLPEEVRSKIVIAMIGSLKSGKAKKIIQFSYSPSRPCQLPKGFGWRKLRTVWKNFPPAFIYELTEEH